MTENTGTTTRNNSIRRHFISECRDNRIVVETHLSPTIQRIYRRHFDGFSRAVYMIRYYSRIARETTVESLLTKEIAVLIDEANENIQKKIAVADQMLAKNKVKTGTPQFEKMNVTIIDPLSNRFLQCINNANDFNEKLSALWLACVLDDEQRSKAIADIEAELRSIQEKSRSISVGLMDRVKSQQAPIKIAEAEVEEHKADKFEPGEALVGIKKTTATRKPRKSSTDDAVSDQDNTETIKPAETTEAAIA